MEVFLLNAEKGQQFKFVSLKEMIQKLFHPNFKQIVAQGPKMIKKTLIISLFFFQTASQGSSLVTKMFPIV